MRQRGRMVIGIGLVLIGLFATVAGVAIVLLVGPDGSVTLAPTRLLSDGHAVTLPQLDVPTLPAGQTVTLDVALSSSNPSQPLFVGVGPSGAVDAYLRDVPIDVIAQIDWPGAARTDSAPGTASPAAPSTQSFWVASASGAAPTLRWRGVPGDWTLVIMRVDGRAPIDASANGSVTLPALGPLGIVLSLLSIAVLAGGTWITIRAAVATPEAASPPRD